ncbi:expressed unknown protein [Seminavis robusta]|uniref:Uncharacterized protein n=1 Tax=Seminavis robusta TaxID=568900 RepID=A0A9N8H510_9STRA|nr:expressed unknown protein [Seminavis robusta]|eukprot:Sro129_g061690.1 n/a (304) ;mRNA; f:94771-95682
MPRFGDRWVVDRTLFEYVNGGSCACCGFNHFLPGGTKDMIHAMSDLETDAANAEVNALQASPWPANMRDAVWGDRLKLRHLMKKEMPKYATFWKEHAVELEEWCRSGADVMTLKKIFQMPRAEVTERVKNDYGIHSAFAVVLCTVVEQVANFPATQLPTDARGESETNFEQALVFDRRGGFTLKLKQKDGSLNTDVLQIWLYRMKSLGGPKLLERAPPKKKVVADSSDEEEEDDEDGDADAGGLKQQADPDEDEPASGPSFRSDRRIIRLLIARYWADQMMKKFLEAKQEKNKQDNNGKEEAS